MGGLGVVVHTDATVASARACVVVARERLRGDVVFVIALPSRSRSISY